MVNLKSKIDKKEVQKPVDKIAGVISYGYSDFDKLREVITNYYVFIVQDNQKLAKLFHRLNRTISNFKKVLI